jgi:subtilisin family serine protease
VTLGSPIISQEYALPLLGVQRAQSVVRGRDVLIGIVDTGIDLAHPDLRGAVAVSQNLIDAPSAMSPGEHGTAIAGIIAARGTDGGVVGIAPESKLVVIEACAPRSSGSAEAVCTADHVARGIDLAVHSGVQILNLSFGGPLNTVVDRMVLQAILVHHVVVVAAAGNNGPHGPLMYPAALPGVIAVGATDNRDMLDAHSNLGPDVSLLAPGVDVMTTLPQDRYAFVSGTSYAAAVTSGALALLMEAAGHANPSEAVAALRGGADPIQVSGERLGRVNVCRALSLLGRADICAAVPGADLVEPVGR